MTNILERIGSDRQDEGVLRFLRRAVSGAGLRVAGDWPGVIDRFYPVNPRALLVQAPTIDDQGARLIRDVREEAPWVPVIVLGTLDEVASEMLLGLVACDVTTFVDPGEANGSVAILESKVLHHLQSAGEIVDWVAAGSPIEG